MLVNILLRVVELNDNGTTVLELIETPGRLSPSVEVTKGFVWESDKAIAVLYEDCPPLPESVRPNARDISYRIGKGEHSSHRRCPVENN